MDEQHDLPIGWTDTSCPDGRGYRIMTEDGIKSFDMDEKLLFDAEVARVAKLKKD